MYSESLVSIKDASIMLCGNRVTALFADLGKQNDILKLGRGNYRNRIIDPVAKYELKDGIRLYMWQR